MLLTIGFVSGVFYRMINLSPKSAVIAVIVTAIALILVAERTPQDVLLIEVSCIVSYFACRMLFPVKR